jgi:hypothetical protein
LVKPAQPGIRIRKMPDVHRNERAELAKQLAECCRRLRLLTEARRRNGPLR